MIIDQFQAGLHRILRGLPGVTSTIDKSDIPTYQAELGLLLAALGTQQQHHPKDFKSGHRNLA